MKNLLLCLVTGLFINLAYAEIPKLLVNTEINNGQWEPIPKSQMKAAVVDAALAELSSDPRFEIVESGETDGRLEFDISLLGSAGVLKLKTSLLIAGEPSQIANVSVNIDDLGFKGMYEAFEFVGTESARRLNAKARLTEESTLMSQEWRKTFSRAQELKRSGEYVEARMMFEDIVNHAPETDSLYQLADKELKVTMFVYQADQLLTSGGFGDLGKTMAQHTYARLLYKSALANAMKKKEVMEINAKLDTLSTSRKYLSRAIKTNFLTSLSPLRAMMMEFWMTEGSLDKKRVTSLIQQATPHLKLVSMSKSGQISVIVEDSTTGMKAEIYQSGGHSLQLREVE